MKEAYLEKTFHRKTLAMIEVCNGIIDEYCAQGYRLTIRQLYYQLVARDHIPNTVRSYDNIVVMLTNARLAGLVDWDAIEDRTRSFIERPTWVDGSQILRSAAHSYHEDVWADQQHRVIVIVEKEALAGVLERTCRALSVPLLPARGYPSATTLRELAKARIMGACQDIVVIHLGDHDPSGIDMSRDLEERLELFSRGLVDINFRRVALNMDQVEELRPPPNPAKITDSRYDQYRQIFGEESWELDALSPRYLHNLLTEEIESFIDTNAWEEAHARVDKVKQKLDSLAQTFTAEE